jgi:uncharacterized protein YgiM (DUF1202 family)
VNTIHTQTALKERVQAYHYGCALADYQAVYPDPITIEAGEPLMLSGKEDNWQGFIWLWCTNQHGKSGWVPQGYVLQTEHGCVARCDYDAIELNVQTGEALLVAQAESSWLWCANQHGKSGWVPADHVRILSALLMDIY